MRPARVGGEFRRRRAGAGGARHGRVAGGAAPGLALLWVSPLALAAGAVAVTAVGLWAVRAARAGGDPGWVVIDEVAGQWIALLALAASVVAGALAAFAAFRLFDIAKPGPVGLGGAAARRARGDGRRRAGRRAGGAGGAGGSAGRCRGCCGDEVAA